MTARRKKAPAPQTILLDIYERLGRVETQNMAIIQEQAQASLRGSEIVSRLARMEGDDDTLADRVSSMEPHVESWKKFRAQLALAAISVSAIVSGALWLIWLAVTHLGEIRDALRNVLHWILSK